MYDDEGNVSDAVEYTLADLGGGTYRMTVTADAEWINAEDRAFPVTIDYIRTLILAETQNYGSALPR